MNRCIIPIVVIMAVLALFRLAKLMKASRDRGSAPALPDPQSRPSSDIPIVIFVLGRGSNASLTPQITDARAKHEAILLIAARGCVIPIAMKEDADSIVYVDFADPDSKFHGMKAAADLAERIRSGWRPG